MRTTVTLDPDVEALVREAMNRRGIGFKNAINDGLRAGLDSRKLSGPFKTPTFKMGTPSLSLDKALRLAAAIEDEELTHRLALRK